jgi:integrase/recombinase XerD
MTTLRQAMREYVRMRRDLGFKLRDAENGLLDFARFMEQHRASYITQALALAWAQQPSHVQPAHWAKRLSFVRGFAKYRSATDSRTQIPAPGLLPFRPKRARPYLYSDAEIRGLLGPRSRCPAATNVGSCVGGSTTVCSGS